ncbi:C40 family peptidase [Kinneretia aquatilis]|uniref:C40 family peptidase n=1 Tax=Kinneretia aquatilis TaxID=2070761 RepID=UPI0032DB6633
MLDASRQTHSPTATSLGRAVRALGLMASLGLMGASLAQAQTTPPPGMVTGAYGQSLLQNSSSSQLTAGPTNSQNPSAATGNGNLAPLPAAQAASGNGGAAHGPAGVTASTSSDPVSRFLQERGLLAQAESNSLLNQVRDTASGLVLSAMNFLGVRYTRGGKSVESGFDCSGFTRHIFELSVGMVLPHRADEQARLASLLPINKTELKPGDLVFFNTMRRTFSHVGIYVGEGKFIHSPRVGGAVRVEDMREAYWAKRFTGARRADLNAAAANNNAPAK